MLMTTQVRKAMVDMLPPTPKQFHGITQPHAILLEEMDTLRRALKSSLNPQWNTLLGMRQGCAEYIRRYKRWVVILEQHFFIPRDVHERRID